MHTRTLARTDLSKWARVLGVALFAVLTAISARVSVPVAFSPVPLTLQVLVVVLSGFVLGPWGGLMAQVVYLQAILLGAPLTAAGLGGPAAFVMPSAGYLVAFPIAAAAAGWLSHRATSHQVIWRALGGLVALAVIYVAGMLWLAPYVGGLKTAWVLGVVPFVGADAAKVAIATAAFSLRRR